MKPVRIAFVILLVTACVLRVSAATTPGALTFSNIPLITADGNSEPELAIGPTGVVAVDALSWLQFVTNLWTGAFGAAPTFRGPIDSGLQRPGRRTFGGGDADIDLGSTGTLHGTTLIFLVNRPFTTDQFGVSAITCPGGESSTLDVANCTRQIIDTAGADRPWIASDGARVFISYHDAGNSSLVHVQRSDDDGFTWKRVGDPIVGQGRATASSTFNNTHGPMVADPVFHNIYTIYTAGEPDTKAKSAAFNNVFVSRSADGGHSWTAALVAHYPVLTDLSNVFPALAVDPVSGNLAAVWSDGHHTFFSTSSDQGQTWSSPVAVNAAPATTAIFPWVASRHGATDVVYYGTTAPSKDDASAVWNVYLAQTADSGASFAQSLVSAHSNHSGVVCTEGIGCAPGTRNLLDLFKVAINAAGKAAVVYTDDTLTMTSSGDPLPQIVLAYQK